MCPFMNPILSVNKAKTTEAITLILKLHQKSMILDQLMKMMYFIDSLYLAQNNKSLTNDSYEITKGGLVPHQVGDIISELQSSGVVSNFPKGYVTLSKNPKMYSLTDLEIKIITHIYLQKRGINPFNFLDWNYDLDFLQSHTKQYGQLLVTPIHIMLHLGKTKAEILTYINSEKFDVAELEKGLNTSQIASVAI